VAHRVQGRFDEPNWPRGFG